MEDALVRTAERRSVFLKHVLILVLMEDALVRSSNVDNVSVFDQS